MKFALSTVDFARVPSRFPRNHMFNAMNAELDWSPGAAGIGQNRSEMVRHPTPSPATALVPGQGPGCRRIGSSARNQPKLSTHDYKTF